ncbi:hypothetical protein ABZ208_27825 [Streptomyces sp. NPDC006208]|uniref:hypothetical protein n=1 Tax=Streptomyces sp. NPDC006208 TaxID=3156734 RepID=UPI0033A9ACFF
MGDEAARTAERAAQHRLARVVLPLLAAAAVVVGLAVGVLMNGQLGLVAGLVVAGLGAGRLYRRAHNSWVLGAAGEARTARLLAPLVRKSHAVVLHDRALEGSEVGMRRFNRFRVPDAASP